MLSRQKLRLRVSLILPLRVLPPSAFAFMLSPEKHVLVCEQCNQPLGSGGTVTGCLNCLLLGGLEPGAPSGSPASSSPAPATNPTRFYQHYEIFTRPDGNLWELGRGAMGVSYKARDVNLRHPRGHQGHRRGPAHPGPGPRPLPARGPRRRRSCAIPTWRASSTSARPRPASASTPWSSSRARPSPPASRARAPCPPSLVVEIALQVTAALLAADERGLVHRDLKPANLMLTTEGIAAVSAGTCPSHDDGDAWAKVIDFGLAKAIRRALGAATNGTPAGNDDDGPLTRGGFLGTPQFASPEQFDGADRRAFGHLRSASPSGTR